MRSSVWILALVSVLGGCDFTPVCGPDLTYDRTRELCVCPNGGQWEARDASSGVCVLPDGSVSTLDSMRDAGIDVDDAGGCATSVFYRDADGDGYGGESESVRACTAPAGFVGMSGDCNDACATCHPGATEACNSSDDDCDGDTDESLRSTFFRDRDGDGFGSDLETISSCTRPDGFVEVDGDCDDACAACQPGATDTCDRRDNDCDAATDEGLQTQWFADCDRDGFAAGSASTMLDCEAPEGGPSECAGGSWTLRAPIDAASADCRDDAPTAFPGQTMYLSTPITSAASGRRFDFNCDGVETPVRSSGSVVACTPSPSGCRGGGVRSGTSGAVACGATGTEWYCVGEDFGSGLECTTQQRPFTMSCR